MMDARNGKILMTALQNLPQGNAGLAWEDGARELYGLLLRDVPSALAEPLAAMITRNCRFRPSTEQLQGWIGQLCGVTALTGADVAREILDAVRKYGPYGKSHPERPSIMIAGEPGCLSEAARETVEYLGGWQRCCLVTGSEKLGFEEHLARKAEIVVKRMREDRQLQSMAQRLKSKEADRAVTATEGKR